MKLYLLSEYGTGREAVFDNKEELLKKIEEHNAKIGWNDIDLVDNYGAGITEFELNDFSEFED